MTGWVKKIGLAMMTAVLAAGLAACNSDKDPAAEEEPNVENRDPVDLVVFDTLLTDEEYSTYVESSVREAYPHINLERITLSAANSHVADMDRMMTSGHMPDVVLTAIFQQHHMQSIQFIQPLEDLIRKHNTDLSKVDQVLLDASKTLSADGKVYALPIYANVVASYYNKDIFDRFGVDYPKDGMTWNEALEMSRRLTQTSDGVEYYGMYTGGHGIVQGQLGLNVLDVNTNRSVVTSNDGFRRVFELHRDLYTIPGMKIFLNQAQAREAFFKDRTLAMLVDWAGYFVRTIPTAEGLNWDMATMPVFPDQPGRHSRVDFHAAFVSSATKHPDEAFEVVSLLPTEEVQMKLSRAGRIPVLNDQAIFSQFGSDIMVGKNTSAISQTQMVPLSETHALENRTALVGKHLADAMPLIASGAQDVNTALREAAEKIDAGVAAELAK